jgi:hypothetical protein
MNFGNKETVNTGMTWPIGFGQNGRSLNGTKSGFEQKRCAANVIAYVSELQRDWGREATVPQVIAIFERHAGDFGQGLRWEWQSLALIGKDPHERFDRACR